MTHVSLFSGVGALDLAAEWAGFQTVLQVERDPYCLKVLERHWPDVPRITDIREVHADDRWRNPTVVSGGFPCQPFSAAGKRGGSSDDRFLWPEMCRVISEVRPTWVVAENVAGLLSLVEYPSLPDVDGGRGDAVSLGDVHTRVGQAYLETILAQIEALGYEVCPIVVPAAGVGAPHRRDRVFIVAHRYSGRREIERITEHNPVGCACGAEPDGLRAGRRRDGKDVAYTNRTGRIEQRRPEPVEQELAAPECGGWWESQSAVGRAFDGLAPWLDGDWERGIPRVATGVPNRVDRLRAVGNAVVPQQAYPVFAAIRGCHAQA